MREGLRTKSVIGCMAIWLALIAPVTSWGRGGGGCLVEGTQILTPNGAVPVEMLRTGDSIVNVTEGGFRESRIRAITAVETEQYLEITAGRAKVEATAEHPMMVAKGEFRVAGRLRVGDAAWVADEGKLEAFRIQNVHRVTARRRAYDLLVDRGGMFCAGGFVVHNKGCFFPESPILKADGTESPISTLMQGEEVFGLTAEGRLVRTRVREVLRHEAEDYILLRTERVVIRATAEHPFYVGHGTFKTIEALKQGDSVFAWDGKGLTEQRIVSLQRVEEHVQVFNLRTDPPNTYFAGHILVHNKGGGCFGAGTRIATPHGAVPIEGLASGDAILAVDDRGRTVPTRVRVLFVSRSPVMQVRTGEETLAVTEEHPMGTATGRFRPAGDLRSGDRILKWEGGDPIAGKVDGVSPPSGNELVFNLQVEEPNTFIANGVIVHNKGGGGSGRSGSGFRSHSGSGGRGGSSSGGNLAGLITMFVLIGGAIVLVVLLSGRKRRAKSENLDYIYKAAIVSAKAIKTEKLLVFLGRQDPSVLPDDLKKLVESTFRTLQECWQAREYGPMKSLLMQDLFVQHTAQIAGLSGNHEINRIENLKVQKVDLVHIRYTEKVEHREITALITASARDYYVDDRTGKFLRGDDAPARFQEFWTFQRQGGQWLLREIEQAGESDMLKEENFAEMLTDDTIKGIYGQQSLKEGAAGPWLEKETEEKATRIDRLLNFLVQTDKLWNRGLMLERARQIFLSVYLARESGKAEGVPAGDLFPDVAGSLREQISRWQSGRLTVEYRNLCVRKVELIHVRNFAERVRDEFTVRISAHAQRITRKDGQIQGQQAYVTPFEEYWTFGRLGEQWKLKEVLPSAAGKKKIAEENVDEDSSSDQLQWYYRQNRGT
jgi:predicted lipid-binding transport protein (Tim44 family)